MRRALSWDVCLLSRGLWVVTRRGQTQWNTCLCRARWCRSVGVGTPRVSTRSTCSCRSFTTGGRAAKDGGVQVKRRKAFKAVFARWPQEARRAKRSELRFSLRPRRAMRSLETESAVASQRLISGGKMCAHNGPMHLSDAMMRYSDFNLF